MEGVFHLSIFANHFATSKLAAYFQIVPCDFFSLLVLHQCSFLFRYLSSVSLYEVGTALCTQLSNPLDEGEMGRETNQVQYICLCTTCNQKVYLCCGTQRHSFLTLSSCEDRRKIFSCQQGSILNSSKSFIQLSFVFLKSLCIPEKQMFLWFSLKEMFLIAKMN